VTTKSSESSQNFAIRKARERLAGGLIPREVHLELTHRCNLKCFHCYLDCCDSESEADELSTAQVNRILDELFEMGVYYVTFSGGEPFCRPDIFEVMEHARERGLFFGIMTNGTLITESVADRIKALGTLGVDVSLYGASASTHERVTRVSGSFDKAISALKLLRERKIRVGVKTTLMKCNSTEHWQIESIARDVGAAYRPDPILFPKVGDPASAAYIRMDDEQLRAVITERHWVPGEKDLVGCSIDSHLTCGAGRTRCAVSPQGDVFPCTLWRVSLGNLGEKGFREIWHGELARQIRDIRHEDMEVCSNCEFVSYCARCPGLVYMEDGDILGPSSENCRLARATKGVRDESN
jgi:radical SAM protein with 4Fe4S-binding SPASM domain